MTSPQHPQPQRPGNGNGGNGGGCVPSTSVDATATAQPGGSVPGGTTVQLVGGGEVVTTHKDCTRHTQRITGGTWSLWFQHPGQAGSTDVTGMLSSTSGLTTTFFASARGTYTAQFDAQGGLDFGSATVGVAVSSDVQFEADGAPAMASSGNVSVIVVKDKGGRVWYTWWNLGDSGPGWVPLDANVLADFSPAAALVGAHHDYLFVTIRGTDKQLYINQGNLGRPFVGWR